MLRGYMYIQFVKRGVEETLSGRAVTSFFKLRLYARDERMRVGKLGWNDQGFSKMGFNLELPLINFQKVYLILIHVNRFSDNVYRMLVLINGHEYEITPNSFFPKFGIHFFHVNVNTDAYAFGTYIFYASN